MHKIALPVLSVLLFLTSLGRAHAAQEQLQDLLAFDEQVKATHPSLFDAHGEEDWDAAVASLAERCGQLDSTAFFLSLTRLAGMAQDGHTSVIPTPEFRRTELPIGFAFFGDELYITCASERYAAVVGGRVTAIGSAPVERALRELDQLGCGDNERGARLRLEFLLRHAALQHGLGWGKAGEESLGVIFDDGRRVQLTLDGPQGARHGAPLPPHGPVPEGWVSAVSRGTPALWQQRLDEPWWFEVLQEENAIYVAFNSVTDRPGKSLEEFWAQVFARIEADGIERMLIDMRHNGGGDGYKNQPLVHALIRSNQVNLPGRLFVISGPRTFSAAIMGLADLESQTYAMIVGEPSGAGPAHYGDATTLTLPHSGLRVRCSTLYHQFSDGRDRRRWIEPDLAAPVSFKDFVNAEDPALAAALLFDEEDAASFGEWPPNAHWMRASQRKVPSRPRRRP